MNWLLALSSALALAALTPRLGLTWLAPVALTPLLIALHRETKWRQRVLFGIAAGFTYWAIVCIWIHHVLSEHGGLGPALAWLAFVLFALYKSLHLAAFSYAAPRLAPPLAAALWTGIERTHGTFGFAWLTLGDAAINIPWLLGVPPILGVYGLSFLFALSAAAAASAILSRKAKPLAWLAVWLIVIPLPKPNPADPDQTALAVQAMMPEAQSWTREILDQRLSHLRAISQQPAPLVIWPEMPGPIYFDEDPSFHELATNIAKAGNRNFLFGTVTRAPNRNPYNSAVLLNPDGSEAARYSKMNLVPFGEFVPSPFAFINKITEEAGDYEPGPDQHTLKNFGVFICYESAFPDFVRQYPVQGAQVFANLSNDGYFGESKAREQHLNLVRMRAVENRRWILRVTNTGITASVDPAGRIRDRLPEYQSIAQPLRYGLTSDITPYSRYGDWFAWTCLAVGLAASLYRLTR